MIKKYIGVFMYSTRYSFPCGQTVGKTDGRTNRYGEANSRVSQLCERAQNSEHAPYCVSHDVEIQQLYELTSAFPNAASDDIAVHSSPVLSVSPATLRTATRDKNRTNGHETWNACLICLYNPLHISVREIAACSRRISRLSRQ
jgi:hypothetical protein